MSFTLLVHHQRGVTSSANLTPVCHGLGFSCVIFCVFLVFPSYCFCFYSCRFAGLFPALRVELLVNFPRVYISWCLCPSFWLFPVLFCSFHLSLASVLLYTSSRCSCIPLLIVYPALIRLTCVLLASPSSLCVHVCSLLCLLVCCVTLCALGPAFISRLFPVFGFLICPALLDRHPVFDACLPSTVKLSVELIQLCFRGPIGSKPDCHCSTDQL